ncbi:MAG: hypothetical protein AAF253_01075 [Pseudomonadota bacterium]
MLEQINAIEAAAELPDYKCAALDGLEREASRAQPGTRGAFMGYDFHITPDGPRLIEINTNAGGAFLVDALDRAVQTCGLAGHKPFTPGKFENRVIEMMLSEWRGAGRSGRPSAMAIVDVGPDDQYLYPDMLLARRIFTQVGIETVTTDAEDLTLDGSVLKANGRPVDMVYNRLTDFTLSEPRSETLRTALIRDQAVISPAPRHHALYANKRNLVRLSNRDQLESWGLAPHHLEALNHIPDTIEVTAEAAHAVWANRKRLFFKPASGFGGRAAYRGDKLTRRTWAHILKGGYVAQTFVPPQLRGMHTKAGGRVLKFDIRVFTYAGDPLLLAARVYQGQTTNFRTDGGGFAPVILVNV